MTFLRPLGWTLLLVLLMAPLAQAGHGGEVRFLQDDEPPAVDGRLVLEMPEGENASVRPMLSGEAGMAAGRFVHPEDHPLHLKGPLFAGVWLAEAPELAGTVEVALLRVGADGSEEIAEAAFEVGGEAPIPQDPTTLLPPDPTDPEAAAWHVIGQAYPVLFRPPYLVDFGSVDLELAEGESLAVVFRMAEGSVALAALKYDASISPSFLWLPWHPEAEPGPDDGGSDGGGNGTPEPAPEPSRSASPPGGAGAAPPDRQGEEADQDTPGAPLALLLVAFVVLALRRRMH